MSAPRVLAIAAHPDDIEFMMAGTLMRLRDAGFDIVCMNVANGCAGSLELGPEETAALRATEAQAAAAYMGAEWIAPIAADLEIFYEPSLLKKLAAIVRRVAPSIIFTHSLEDYMEDHTNTARLAVTATFARVIPNFTTTPPTKATTQDVTVYHAMPHGLQDGMRRRPRPDWIVDTSPYIEKQNKALAFHKSQKDWLDQTQGMGSYLDALVNTAKEMGSLSGRYRFGEGWRRHAHTGFSATEIDPLVEILHGHITAPKG